MRLIFSTRIKKIDIRLERIMLPSLLIILIVSTLVQCDDVCNTPNCEKINRALADAINHDVNPCDDFARHACGNFVYDAASDINDVVDKILKDTLNEPIRDDEIEAARKVKKLYQVCSNKAARDQRGVRPLLDLVNANGKWPLVTPRWFDTNHPTLETIHEKYAKETFISPLIQINYDLPPTDLVGGYNRSWYELELPNIHWELSKEWEDRTTNTPVYEHQDWYDEYFGYIKNIAKLITKESGTALPITIDGDIEDIIEFEAEFDELWRTTTVEFVEMTVSEIQSSWNSAIGDRTELSMDWRLIIGERIPIPHTIDMSSYVGVSTSPDLIRNLAELFKKFHVTTIVNYVHWKVINQLLVHLSKEIEEYDKCEKIAMFGKSFLELRNKKTSCLPMGTNHGISYLVMKKVHIPESKPQVETMVSEVRNEIIREIRQSSWPPAQAKTTFENFLNATTFRIGYPSFYNEPAKLNKMYERLEVTDNYFENVLKIETFQNKQYFKRMTKRTNARAKYFKLKPTVNNAAYSIADNSITLPEVQFSMPAFAVDLPSAYNYGHLGWIVGHELTHAFQYLRFVIGDPNSENWVRQTFYGHEEKMKCFVDQYDPFGRLYGIKDGTQYYHPGATTMGENVADHGGLKASYNVFQKLKREGRLANTKKLSDFTTTSDEKMFFYAYASQFCRDAGKNITESAAEDSHAPARYRIIGGVQNMQEFADAFGCQPQTMMNPAKKCNVWV